MIFSSPSADYLSASGCLLGGLSNLGSLQLGCFFPVAASVFQIQSVFVPVPDLLLVRWSLGSKHSAYLGRKFPHCRDPSLFSIHARLLRSHRNEGCVKNWKIHRRKFCTILCGADFQHFQPASRTPSAGNWVNEIAAWTLHLQRTSEWVGLTFLTVLGCLIFKDHDHIHRWRSPQLKVIVSTLRGGQSAGLSGYPTSEGDYDFQFAV